MLKMNLHYLKEEKGNLEEKIALIQQWLKQNPSRSISKRSVRGIEAYYERFRMGDKVFRNWVCNASDNEKISIVRKEILELKKKIKERRESLNELKKQKSCLERQIRIVEKQLNE